MKDDTNPGLSQAISEALAERAEHDRNTRPDAQALMRRAVVRRRQRVTAAAGAAGAATIVAAVLLTQGGLGRTQGLVPAGTAGSVTATQTASSSPKTSADASGDTSGDGTGPTSAALTREQASAALGQIAAGVTTEQAFSPAGGVAYSKDAEGRVVVSWLGTDVTIPTAMSVRFTDVGNAEPGTDGPRASFVVGRVQASGVDEVWAVGEGGPVMVDRAGEVLDLVADRERAVWISRTGGTTVLKSYDIATKATVEIDGLTEANPVIATLGGQEVTVVADSATRTNRATSRVTTTSADDPGVEQAMTTYNMRTGVTMAQADLGVVAATPDNGGRGGPRASVVFRRSEGAVCAYVMSGSMVAPQHVVCGREIDSSMSPDNTAVLLNVYEASGVVRPLIVSLPGSDGAQRVDVSQLQLVAPLMWESDLSVVTSLGDEADPGRGLRIPLGKDGPWEIVTGLPASP